MDLKHLFSPLSGCPSHPLPFDRLAVLGPLPASASLHAGLAFVQQYKAAQLNNSRLDENGNDDDEDADAREAVQKDTPPQREPYVLVLSSSRLDLYKELVAENEEVLAGRGGEALVMQPLQDNVEFRFLNNMAAFMFFCSSVHVVQPVQDSSGGDKTDAADEGGAGADPASFASGYTDVELSKVRIKQKPDLVIVEGMSRYLEEPRNSGSGVEAYARLLATVLAAFTSTSTPASPGRAPASTQILLLDDPGQKYASIPLLPSHLNSTLRKRRQPDGGPDGRPAPMLEPRKMELRRLYEYFVDAVGEVTEGGSTEDRTWYDLTFQRSPRSTEEPPPRASPPSKDSDFEYTWKDIDVRYTVHAGVDQTGYSGLARLAVRFE